MLYTFYEMGHAALTPWRAAVNLTRRVWTSPLNPQRDMLHGRTIAAAADVFESVTRRYRKPDWELPSVAVEGADVRLTPKTVWSTPWVNLVHFERNAAELSAARGGAPHDPRLLIVAPMSGHHATLLRGTVEAFAPKHEVYITDWVDARLVPVGEGRFTLDDYVSHIRDMIRVLGPQTHVLAVCQPGPPVLAATALMNEDGDACAPATVTFMGSPIDARRSPTEPNRLAEERPLEWFASNMIQTVPWPHPGALRRVYPGFVQLASFMNMNWDRHVNAHWTFFEHLVADDGDNAENHRKFYDEYLSVMDLTEEFYVDTIDRVFQRHCLAKGDFYHHGRLVRTEAVTRSAIFTVEGENDDISGVGQTSAALDLCSGLPDTMKKAYVQPRVGHYGVFNGRRFREEIRPRVEAFIRKHWDESRDGGAVLAPADAAA